MTSSMSAASSLQALAANIDAALPQTQCTRCGYPDCASYAQAIASGEAAINHVPRQMIAEALKQRQSRESGYREQALKIYPWICGRCAREFTHQNLQQLTVHHRDHNHDNNPKDGSNWELLCLYCHDNEHARELDADAARQAGVVVGRGADRGGDERLGDARSLRLVGQHGGKMLGPPWIQGLGVGELVDQHLDVGDVAMDTGTGQRRGQMSEGDGRDAALGLQTCPQG